MFPAPLASRCYSHGKVETDEEFDARWVTYFSKPDIDAWELRKGIFFFSFISIAFQSDFEFRLKHAVEKQLLDITLCNTAYTLKCCGSTVFKYNFLNGLFL